MGLGCITMTGGRGGHIDRDEMITLVRSAVERGVSFFDTADVYGLHTNEELIGEALGPFHGQVVIATKFAQDITPSSASPRAHAAVPEIWRAWSKGR